MSKLIKYPHSWYTGDTNNFNVIKQLSFLITFFFSKLITAFFAYAMGKVRFGVLSDVTFNLLPITLVVTNIFIPGKNPDNPLYLFELIHILDKYPYGKYDSCIYNILKT
jgi:hypothetical protein